MATGLVIHISSGKDKHTEVLTEERIRIGTCDDCEVRLRSSSLPASAATNDPLLELTRSNGYYKVTAIDGAFPLTINGKPLQAESAIEDGDEVALPGSELALQFFPIRSLPAVIQPRPDTQVAPFIEQAAIQSAATPRRYHAMLILLTILLVSCPESVGSSRCIASLLL